MSTTSKNDAHLLVEGKDDQHVALALRRHHNVPESFDIFSPETSPGGESGIEALLKLFRLKLRESNKRAIGIVLDADQDISHRWEQVKGAIQQTKWGYTLPKVPEPTGTILLPPAPNRPRIGIWLMPDNQNLGMLEDFAAYLIPAGDALRPYANKILTEIETASLNRYSPVHHSKAFIHTWLAWQVRPGMPMGQAITAKALSADSPVALTFVNWLNRLFNP